jgi:hypothetical protein
MSLNLERHSGVRIIRACSPSNGLLIQRTFSGAKRALATIAGRKATACCAKFEDFVAAVSYDSFWMIGQTKLKCTCVEVEMHGPFAAEYPNPNPSHGLQSRLQL